MRKDSAVMPVADAAFMARAVVLAHRGCGHTRPNPPVGAVVAIGGKIVGEGYHHRAGEAHAEVNALADAARHVGVADFSRQDATLYVTLEPCSRPGRVGACTDAIIASGVRRVVYAVPDPNPTNRGKSKRILRRAGVEVVCMASDLKGKELDGDIRRVLRDASALIAPFAKHVCTGLPWVTVKIALSLDGRICDAKGDARWISSPRSRRLTGELRAEVDAIVVGAETVRRDNPSLLCHSRRNDDLIRVVVSKSGHLPKTAQVFADGRNVTLVYDDAKRAIRDLGRLGALHVLCEGGLSLATSLSEAGLVDEWWTVLSPCVIGTRPIGRATRMKLASLEVADPKSGDCLTKFCVN